MILDDRGTDGSNPACSSGESVSHTDPARKKFDTGWES
jgi:hypothetical protein